MVGDTELDELFATSPASFVSARNALVKKAQAAGQQAQASEIRALRKPTMVVWLINQLARRHRDEVAALTKAGEQLREAQLKGSRSLREANEAWRQAITTALRRIRAIAGRSIDEPRIVSTLMGAVADPAHADLLARGRLTEELQPPGVDGVLGELAKAPPRRGVTEQERAPAATPARDETRAERHREREAAKERRLREREAENARKEAARAERSPRTLSSARRPRPPRQ